MGAGAGAGARGGGGDATGARDAAMGVAGTNLVAYNRIPRSMSIQLIHTYLKAVAMEAPEKLDRAVLAEVVNDMPREALESRRYSVAETLEDIKARIAKIGVATAGHGGAALIPAYDDASIGMAAAAGQRAQAFNPDVDPWLKQREHDHDTRTSAGAAVSDADAYHMVHTAPIGRREWNLGGWKVKDIGVVVVGKGNAARHVIHHFQNPRLLRYIACASHQYDVASIITTFKPSVLSCIASCDVASITSCP